MHPDWEPTFSELTLVALKNAKVTDRLIESELPKYIACLIDKPGREHTQHEWTNLFKTSLIKIGLSSNHEKIQELADGVLTPQQQSPAQQSKATTQKTLSEKR